jgi:type I restriction enzyme R subunit
VKTYAGMFDVPYAYSSNGHGFVEFDFFFNRSREISIFPAPDELWHRWALYRSGQATPQFMSRAAESEEPLYGSQPARAQRHPLLYPYCPSSICGKEPHYFQKVAIRLVIERIIAGQKKILLTMATGTGKTFTAFQIVWKLKKSGWLRKPVRFIADRTVLRDQAYNTFAPFVDSQSDPRHMIGG